MNKTVVNIILTIFALWLFIVFIFPYMNTKAKGDYALLTPTITPNCSPTSTPYATPTPTGAPVSTLPPQNNNGGGRVLAPSAINTTTPSMNYCAITFPAPVLTSITAGQSGALTVNWVSSATSLTSFSIIYGLVGGPLLWGVNNIPVSSNSFTIRGLPNGSYINAQVWDFENGCANRSAIVDPRVE